MEDFFPLEQLPFDLQSIFLEKFPYKDYANFSQCSNYANNLSENHPTVRFDLPMPMVSFKEHSETCVTPFGSEIPLHRADFYKARIVCKRLIIRRGVEDLTAARIIQRYGVRTECLIVLGEIVPECLEKLLKVAKPQKLECTTTGAILSLEQVKKLPDLTSDIGSQEITDMQLFGLQGTNLSLSNCSEITLDGLLIFIEQCIRKDRIIEKIELHGCNVENPEAKMKDIALRLPFRLKLTTTMAEIEVDDVSYLEVSVRREDQTIYLILKKKSARRINIRP